MFNVQRIQDTSGHSRVAARSALLQVITLQRHNTENSKQYSKKRNCAATVSCPHSCVCERFIFPRSICLFCCRKICGRILGIYKSLTDTVNVEIGTVAAQFPKKEYITCSVAYCISKVEIPCMAIFGTVEQYLIWFNRIHIFVCICRMIKRK
jgi:hypothetical protein